MYPNPLRFLSLGRKKIAADFAGGDLTGDRGLVLLREVDLQIGLIDAPNTALCGIHAIPTGSSTISGRSWHAVSLPWPPAMKT